MCVLCEGGARMRFQMTKSDEKVTWGDLKKAAMWGGVTDETPVTLRGGVKVTEIRAAEDYLELVNTAETAEGAK